MPNYEFLIQSIKDCSDDCLIWPYFKDKQGYGSVYTNPSLSYKSRMQYCHRVSWTIYNGLPIPEGFDVLHKCDNPPCFNPKHLFIGTQADNNRDRDEKGRHVAPDKRGEKHHLHKLKESDVLTIIKRYREGGVSHRKLAEQYKVSHSCVDSILSGKTWSHLNAV